jgi:hypothetical protein
MLKLLDPAESLFGGSAQLLDEQRPIDARLVRLHHRIDPGAGCVFHLASRLADRVLAAFRDGD